MTVIQRGAQVPVVPGVGVLPGTDAVVAAVTAVMPRAEPVERRSGLVRARMTDLNGVDLYVGWIPGGARVVTRGARVFMHRQADEWRQIPVVQLGENGRPV